MNIALSVILSTLNVVTMMAHVLGCYLLTCQYENGVQNSQQLYLINLAVSEGSLNFLQLLTNHVGVDVDSSSLTVVRHYIKTVRGYGFNTVYLLTMIYLTFDKLLDIHLNIKYHLYWNEQRTKYLITTTWCLTLTSAITVSIVYHYTGFKVHEGLDLYVYPTFNIIFLIIASLTYGFIFHKYKKSRHPPVQLGNTQVRQSTFRVFQRSRFYIPVLLITSFILFMAVPDFIQMACVASGQSHDGHFVLTTCLRILWAISYFIDAVIYILIKTSVRNLLKEKFGLKRETSSRAYVTSMRQSETPM